MLRKLARYAFQYRSVREELRGSAKGFNRALRCLRMEWFAKPRALAQLQGIKVNIACGRLVREGWVNLDLYPPPGASYLDVLNGLPFGTASVTRIHCEHFLEHLRLDEAEAISGQSAIGFSSQTGSRELLFRTPRNTSGPIVATIRLFSAS